MNDWKVKITPLLFRLILGGVFIYAAAGKIVDPAEFARSIENYQIIGAGMSHYAALFLPWIEMYCGIFLLLGIWVRANAAMVSGMTVVFIIALLYALYMDLDISCGCFDSSGLAQKVTWLKIIEDSALLFMGLYLVKFPYGKK